MKFSTYAGFFGCLPDRKLLQSLLRNGYFIFSCPTLQPVWRLLAVVHRNNFFPVLPVSTLAE